MSPLVSSLEGDRLEARRNRGTELPRELPRLGEEWTESVMALAASNCILSCMLVVLADSQGAQAAAAYSSTLSTTAM